MISPQESFVRTLGRASARAMGGLRGLQAADRDDVLATAIMWCWENRATYNVTVPLEAWITGAIRDAYKKWQRGEARTADELAEEIPVPDETMAYIENRSAAAQLVKSLSPQEREIACLRAEGNTRAEIRQMLDITRREYDGAIKHIAALHHLIPDPVEIRRAIRRERNSDDLTPGPMGSIDRAIARMFGEERPGASFTNDYQPGERQYAPWEDCRGSEVYIPGPGGVYAWTVQDYEGDEPNRRLRVTDGSRSWWITEEITV